MAKRKKSKSSVSVLAYLIPLVLVVITGIVSWFVINSRPVSDNQERISFIVKKGQTVDSIGNKLKEEGLIRSQAVFKFTVMKLGIAQKIQAGSFRLSPFMSTTEIANTLTSGRQDFWVTIYEGLRREEIAQALEDSFIQVGADFDSDVFLVKTQGKEGMLFPDTYLFPLDVSEETVASLLINTFNSKIDLDLIKSQGKTLNQVLTLASIVEREANDEASRKMVAGILYNRLDINMALQVDATLQYIKGYNPIHQDWWAPPLAADKNIDSPYNTYKYPGLPPGPICSPSLESIQAVLYPTPNDYLYYITDNQLNMHYAKTFEQHNQNVNKYLR